MNEFWDTFEEESSDESELFFSDLMGWSTPPVPMPQPAPVRRARLALPPPRLALPAPSELIREAIDEAVPQGGRGRFAHAALGGPAAEHVEARWNIDEATPVGTSIDIVVHLHGFGDLGKEPTPAAQHAAFLQRKAVEAGVDLVDAASGSPKRAGRRSLALVPRGKHEGGRAWSFQNLPDRAAFDAMVKRGLDWLCTSVLKGATGSTLKRGRLTLMAHSGGGEGMSTLLNSGVDPDEVVCFDSLYGSHNAVLAWAKKKIATAAAQSALRVFYTACWSPSSAHPSGRWLPRPGDKFVYEPPGPWAYRGGKWRLETTEVSARRLHEALKGELAAASLAPSVAGRFRVERTTVKHDEIPATYSPLLIDDITATLTKTSAPPAATSRPACVDNHDWVTEKPKKPFGDDPPPPKPTPAPKTTEGDEADEAIYTAPDARPYSPAADPSLFRTPPDPVSVTPATEWPVPDADADGASTRALRALGVSTTALTAFGTAGLAALRPIAAAGGALFLAELLRRLRYSSAQLVRPPHSFADDAALARAFGGTAPRAAVLAIRALLAIPGHFRELARRAGTADEAFALENLGWLLMHSLASEVRDASGMNFWLPDSPGFVTPFANPLPGVTGQTSRLITSRLLIDTTLALADYRANATSWQDGPAGQAWRLETGRDVVTGRAPGAPFYTEPFTIAAPIDISGPRSQVQAAWVRRVADFDAGRTTVPLTKCDNAPLTPLRLMAPFSLRGLQLRTAFPSPASAPTLRTLTGLAAVRPAFESVFQAIADLGWNDLVFETQGLGCFRGMKVPGNPRAARRMSQHSLGIAIDINVFENGQNIAGSMDPRIVALFEAFRFRWGKGFPTPDPMHFEYAG
jgi:hypothetical protein